MANNAMSVMDAALGQQFDGPCLVDLAEFQQFEGGANAQVLAVQAAVVGLSEHIHGDYTSRVALDRGENVSNRQ
jgi:hypothetical protein